jgi:hypothetical protein
VSKPATAYILSIDRRLRYNKVDKKRYNMRAQPGITTMIHSPPATQHEDRLRISVPQPPWPLALLLGLLITAIVLLLPPRGAEAGGVVGDGTPGSCDATALSARLTGGGAVRFNCCLL